MVGHTYEDFYFVIPGGGFHLCLNYTCCVAPGRDLLDPSPGTSHQGELSLGMETAIHMFTNTMHTLEVNTMQFLTIANGGTR